MFKDNVMYVMYARIPYVMPDEGPWKECCRNNKILPIFQTAICLWLARPPKNETSQLLLPYQSSISTSEIIFCRLKKKEL